MTDNFLIWNRNQVRNKSLLESSSIQKSLKQLSKDTMNYSFLMEEPFYKIWYGLFRLSIKKLSAIFSISVNIGFFVLIIEL